MKTRPPTGTNVRLTGTFLRSTGQICGGEGSKRWATLECDCGLCSGGEFVAVEPHSEEYRREWFGDLPEAERPKYRHINIHNLQQIGAPPCASDYP